MELQHVIRDLGLTEGTKTLESDWEESQQSMTEGDLFFLAPSFAAGACREIHLSDEIGRGAAALCPRIAARPALKALAWHFHHCLYEAAGPPYLDNTWDAVNSWPTLREALGDDAGMFYLIVLLSGLPRMRQVHESHSVPPDIVKDTVLDVKLWLEEEKQHGAFPGWGLTPHNMAWLLNHFRGILYRIGRLQYQFATFYPRLRAFRHIESGAVLALSEDGVTYTREGQLARGAGENADGRWTARLALTGDAVTGSPLLPQGRALNRDVCLQASEWRQVLGPGDPTLNLHIPAGSPMSHEECGESFRKAVKFFPKHFPERPYVAFVCGSWLLNGELQEFLPSTSNLVRFQKELYLFSIGLNRESIFWRVFGGVPEDLSTAPRDTALRRAILDRASSGEPFRPTAGGCILFPEDLNWGGQVYLRQDLSRWIG